MGATKEAAPKRRSISIDAESVTIGSEPTADIEVRGHGKPFLIEVKNEGSEWWLMNPLRNPHLRVNGKRVGFEHSLKSGDEIQIDGHLIAFEAETKISEILPSFIEQPESDDALWRYFLEESEFDEIMINGAGSIFVDWRGVLIQAPWQFSSNDFLMNKVRANGKSEGPWASWQVHRSLRFHAVLPPLCQVPHITIRKAKKNRFNLDDLLQLSFGSPDQIGFLRGAVKARQNILISGGTSTGKTVLLRGLIQEVAPQQRIVLLEEESEIDWPHSHLISVECGRGNLRRAVVEALRMRPDRLIVSEVRGAEAFEMLQAMNTGHSGSMTTLHANSPREAITRLEGLLLGSGSSLNVAAARRMIAQAVNLVVQLDREADGHRFIQSISRISGIQGETILYSDPLQTEGRGITQKS